MCDEYFQDRVSATLMWISLLAAEDKFLLPHARTKSLPWRRYCEREDLEIARATRKGGGVKDRPTSNVGRDPAERASAAPAAEVEIGA
jgi:hypothetical protein